MRILLLFTILVSPIFLNAQNENSKTNQLLLEWTKAIGFLDAYVGLKNDKMFFNEVESCMNGNTALNSILINASLRKKLEGIDANYKILKAFEKDQVQPNDLHFIYKRKSAFIDIRSIKYNWIFDSEVLDKDVKAKLFTVLHEIDLSKAKKERNLKTSQKLLFVKEFHKTTERKDIVYFYNFTRFWALYAFTYPYQKLNEKTADELFIENIGLVYPNSNDNKMLDALFNLNFACGDNHSRLLFKTYKYHIDSPDLIFDSKDVTFFDGKVLLTEGLMINTEITSANGIIEQGDTIFSINGMDCDSVIQRYGKRISASTPWALEAQLSKILQYSLYAEDFTLKLKKGNDTIALNLDTIEQIQIPNEPNSQPQLKNQTDNKKYLYINSNVI